MLQCFQPQRSNVFEERPLLPRLATLFLSHILAEKGSPMLQIRGSPICPKDLCELFDPSSLGSIHPLLQLTQNYLVRCLGLSIRLRVLHRHHPMLDTEATQELIEFLVCELQTIVCDQHIQNFEACDDIFLEEILDGLGFDVHQWFDLNPFHEEINCHQQESSLSWSRGKGLKNVHPPNSKRPRGDCWIQLFGRPMYQISISLALETFLHKI